MDAELFAGREVTLDALLDARERRSAWQAMLCKRHAGSVVVLTAVTPGAVKHHALSRAVMAQGINLFARLCGKYGFAVQAHYHWQEDAGEVAWWCVAADAQTLKRALIALEESQPTARLWDFDVLDSQGVPLSRQALGVAPRRCLVCDAAAKICARERRHDVQAVQAALGAARTAGSIYSCFGG